MSNLRRGSQKKYPHLKIIDWDLIRRLDPKTLSETKDRECLDDIAATFLQADCLFDDPSYSSPDLVLQLFALMKIVLSEQIAESRRLKAELEAQKANFSKTEQISQVVKFAYPCVHCPKVFETTDYLRRHLKRRHLLTHECQTEEFHPDIKYIRVENTSSKNVPPDHLDLLDLEMKAVLDHVDTLSTNTEIRLNTELGQISRRAAEDHELVQMLRRAKRDQIPPKRSAHPSRTKSEE
jgi:hypothetical protein